MSGFKLDDYVPVSDRIANFYDKYPKGSLQAEVIELSDSRVVVRAYAYREADDPKPAIAHSMLGIPGATQFTRGSEIENAETSAIGRAIAFLGFDVKKGIASREEVQNKQSDGSGSAAGTSSSGGGEPTYVPQGPKSFTGTVAKGDGQFNDVEYHQDPDGHRIGFRLDLGGRSAIHEVIAGGDIGEALFLTVPVEELLGSEVTVEGEAFRIDQQGRRPRSRLVVSSIVGRDFTIPAKDVPKPTEDGLVTDLDDLPF